MRNIRKSVNVNYNKEAVKNLFIVKSKDKILKSLKSEIGYTKINPATFVTFKD
jgi:hypothetical protein